MNATRLGSPRRSVLTATAAALLSCCGAVRADQILQTDGGGLTTIKFTGASAGQNVRMRFDQPGTNLDGSLRAAGGYAWALNANPFEGGAGGARLGDLDLATGTYAPTEIDLALSAPNASGIIIGRMHNHRQEVGGSHHNNNGFQGYNWSALEQPEIVFYDDATNTEDRIYVLLGAGRFIVFKRTGSGSTDPFQARNGAAGVITYTAGSPDTYTWWDPRGNKTTFFGGNTSTGRADWQFWKIEDPAGNVAYVGHATTASTADDDYTGKRWGKMYDGAGRRYCATYDGNNRITQVLVETDAGGGWGNCGTETMVAKADYSYYVNADSHGSDGDLKLVTVTIPLSDSGIDRIERVYYRYYDDVWSNSDGRRGEPHMIKMVVAREGVRRHDYDQDSTIEYGGGGADPEFLTATDADLKPYCAAYLEYVSASDYRVAKAFFNGECGCSGGSNGTYEFAYGTGSNYSTAIGNTSYDNGANDWARTVIKQPDAIYSTRYFDETGQALSRVTTDGDPAVSYTDMWATQVIRDSMGCVTEARSPAANDNSYTHSSGSFTAKTGDGLITLYEREAGAVDTKGFLVFVQHKQGTSGTVYYDAKTEYEHPDFNVSGSVYVTRPMIAARRAYHVVNVGSAGKDTAANYNATTFTNTFWSGTNTNLLYIVPKKLTTTFPAVSTANNGSNSALSGNRYFRKDGTAAFTESTGGRFDYTQFTNGQLTKRIDDVKTNGTFPSGDDPNTDWGITESGNGSDRITQHAYDAQGRLDITTLPDGRVTKTYYSRLKSQEAVTIGFPRRTTGGSTTHFGPASYSVTNQAGRATFQGLIAITSAGLTDALSLWIDETDGDPITALDKGTLARMSTSVYNKPGTRADETRTYFSLPASGAGTEGTHYDAIRYGFDTMGRRYRVKDETATITRTVFDDLGRPTETWVGTNDQDEGGADNIVKTAVMEYDGNADGGNGYLTRRKIDQDGDWGTTGDQGTTDLSYDLRGRPVVALGPQAPYSVTLFDNLGRATAAGSYSSTSGLDAGDDPTSLATNRVALSRTYFDEMGRVYLSETCKIDQSDGSNDDQLQTLTWRDAEGRVVKVDGEQLTKTLYDRLSRVTHSFMLAKDNDTVYADADDVSGDIVLEENQATYESTDSDNAVMSAVISRYHDDLATGTTGALDTNADANAFKYTAANVKRIQIAATWFDDLDRVADTVQYGTYGGSDFDRKPSGSWLTVPARSDTALRTTYTYNDDGTLLQIEDPKALKTRYTYDALGRKSTETRNYVNGTPSGTPDYTTCTDDNITRFEYSKGLQTKMWVDFDGDNVVDTSEPKDQVTTYIYGSNAGTPTPMKLTTGNLLRAVKYPDTTNTGTTVANIDSDSSDVVSYAYNAQGLRVYQKDQAGNIIETDLDTAGRETYRRVTTLAGGFDGAVRRIGTTYLSRGLVERVTQYDNAAVGSGAVVDEVKYTYDDWGNVTLFEQDRNSTVAGGGDDREVAYVWGKNTSGRNTIRLGSMTPPGGGLLTYDYASANSALANDASRVSGMTLDLTGDNPLPIVSYEYNGAAQLVGTTLEEPDVFYRAYSATATYDRLDRFDRVTSSIWTKDLATDQNFYNVAISYDRDGNITDATDNIRATAAGNRNFDVKYTNDDLDRLTKTDEGTFSAGSISNRSRIEEWTLGQTGNPKARKLDLTGGTTPNYSDAGEYQEDGTFNPVNEWTKRELDTNNTAGYELTYNLTYDAVGNLTDDGKDYENVYDAFGRLREVRNTSNQALIAEYKYNGLGYRIQWHYDSRSPSGVDTGDPWYFFVYGPDWRLRGVFRADYNSPYTLDTYPKERFIPHAAGLGGLGGSSYIDAVVLRDRDNTSAFTEAADSSAETRTGYCHNWRSDAAALVTDTGKLLEAVKYSSYGVPFGLPSGDSDASGTYDATDATEITDADAYQVAQDADLDGDNDAADNTHATSVKGGYYTLGRGKLTAVSNRIGYAGYPYDPTFNGAGRHLYHVRHRVLDSELGRWGQRDRAGYGDGLSLYAYARSAPTPRLDPSGLCSMGTACGSSVTTGGGAPDAPGTCAEMVQTLLQDPVIQQLINFLSANCPAGGAPPVSPPGGGPPAPPPWSPNLIKCCPASDPECAGACGYYDPATGGICVCDKEKCLTDIQKVAATLFEELWHAYQDCLRRKGLLPMPPTPPITTRLGTHCDSSSFGEWCMEINAKCQNPYGPPNVPPGPPAGSPQFCEDFCNDYAPPTGPGGQLGFNCCKAYCATMGAACCNWVPWPPAPIPPVPGGSVVVVPF